MATLVTTQQVSSATNFQIAHSNFEPRAQLGMFANRLQTFMSFFGGPTLISFNPGDLASARITGLLDAPPTHTYATEMLSLNLVGLPFGAMIRESPTLPSSGGHTIVDSGLGVFQINSFFDVFTELSLDGGATWTPATGSVHIQNPEPGSLSLLATAALFIRRHRRDHRRAA